jgi:hypothetical protein
MRFLGKRSVAAVAIPVFLLVSACDSGDGGKDAKPSAAVGTGATPRAASGNPAAPGNPGSGQPSGGGKTLAAWQLQDALVSDGDLPGYEALFDHIVDDDIYSDRTVDKPACLPLEQLLSPIKTYRPLAAAEVAVKREGAPLGHDAMLSTAAYHPGTAEKLVAEARAALATCTSYVATGDEGGTIAYTVRTGPAQPGSKDGKAYGFGDDSLVVEFVSELSGSAIVCLVRSGSALVHAYGSAVGNEPSRTEAAAATVPEELIRAQYDKLVKAQQN